MRIGRTAKTTSKSKAAGIACMAAAWMLAAAPAIVAPQAMAQDSASQGADSSTQSAGRSGVAQPSSAPITVTPYSDSDANILPGSVRSTIAFGLPACMLLLANGHAGLELAHTRLHLVGIDCRPHIF